LLATGRRTRGVGRRREWEEEREREREGEAVYGRRGEWSSDKKIGHDVEFFSSYRDWYEHGRATARVIPAGF